MFPAAPRYYYPGAAHVWRVSITVSPSLSQQENDLKKTVDESARIRRAYSHYFDLTIVNDNLDKAFDTLQEAVERLLTEPQWVPVSWVY